MLTIANNNNNLLKTNKTITEQNKCASSQDKRVTQNTTNTEKHETTHKSLLVAERFQTLGT